MAKRQAKPADPDLPNQEPSTKNEELSELFYIPEAWRPFAVRADSLVIDVDDNVKLHADKDLAAQQESLKSWGFTRLVIVRRENRQVVIGNGSVLAAIRNGWEYVPVDFRDLTATQARALGAADNMLGTIADWNEVALQKLLADLPTLDEAELANLTLDVGALCDDVLQRLVIEDKTASSAEAAAPEPPPGVSVASSPPLGRTDVTLCRRVIVNCANESEQIELISRMQNEGRECHRSNVWV